MLCLAPLKTLQDIEKLCPTLFIKHMVKTTPFFVKDKLAHLKPCQLCLFHALIECYKDLACLSTCFHALIISTKTWNVFLAFDDIKSNLPCHYNRWHAFLEGDKLTCVSLLCLSFLYFVMTSIK